MKLNLNKNCFWGHKWNKWRYGTVPVQRYIYGQLIDGVEEYQVRKCERCNKQQREKLS